MRHSSPTPCRIIDRLAEVLERARSRESFAPSRAHATAAERTCSLCSSHPPSLSPLPSTHAHAHSAPHPPHTHACPAPDLIAAAMPDDSPCVTTLVSPPLRLKPPGSCCPALPGTPSTSLLSARLSSLFSRSHVTPVVSPPPRPLLIPSPSLPWFSRSPHATHSLQQIANSTLGPCAILGHGMALVPGRDNCGCALC